ncbi:ABC transporter permease [Puia dinghuensis]|uniref:ABC transporter permease n=1 Tax=Puia dinghuensis TaxID=1792502 RepID=A0A8J2XMW5_9BACT|nr:ABC transporter permease [Puia dinghuensis]GGA81422.1 ABC transporter permease [Puia dinghuensis]
MFRSFLKYTVRQLIRQKGFTAINILGLTVGLASCILIGLFITDELSYDTFHTRAARIVRVTMDYGSSGHTSAAAVTGTKVGPQLKRTFPDIREYVRTVGFTRTVSYGDKHIKENEFLYADSSFLSVFTFPLLMGDPHALSYPHTLMITESAALKYFGTAGAIGKVLRLDYTTDYTVAGVLKDPPGNSQIQFDFVAPFTDLPAAAREDWFSANYYTYLLLNNQKSEAGLEQQINTYMRTPAVRAEAELKGNDYLYYHLEPLTRVHLYSSLEGLEPNGSITSIYILLAIGVLILVIACFNYTNLTIAQSANRTGEIGIRKVLGAARGQLFTQFAGESLLLTLVALVLAIVLSLQLLPLFNQLTGKHLQSNDILQARPLLSILGAALVIGFLAGAYPAILLSGTRLITILRSGFRLAGGNTTLRQTLIVAQFVISLFLIISTVVILQQMHYIRNKDLGYDRDHVLVIPINYHDLSQYNALKTSMAALPGVRQITGSSSVPTSVGWMDMLSADDGNGPLRFPVNCIPSDLGFVKTMNMQLLAGADLTPSDLPANRPLDAQNQQTLSFIINETTAKKIGWTPGQAIGKTIVRYGQSGVVRGVVKDFHFASMHQPIGPLLIYADTTQLQCFLLRIGGGQLPALIDALQTTWKRYIPVRPLEYHFLDEDFNKLYITEQRTATIFTLFASLAIVLACLGLFGLAAISTVQRTKEIGIRKVLGASLLNICLLIGNSFLRMVFLAILIASPLAWIAARKWLEGFAYRIPVHAWIFPMAGVGVVLLAFLTVSFHALRAAAMNPARSLKTE